MKCRIWRKLHAVEAQRFSQAYELMEKMPGIELADAFGIVQSGKTPEQFLARKARVHQKQAIHLARSKIDRSLADGLFQKYIVARAELSVVLGTQTLLDILVREEPIALELERHGRVEKIQIVLITSRARWEELLPKIPRDSRLSKKPLPVAREPERRPVADPRPFLQLVGRTIELQLRNGIRISEPLLGIGPFDLILGTSGAEILIPLHAVVSWKSISDAKGME
jgi:hypothetical protein